MPAIRPAIVSISAPRIAPTKAAASVVRQSPYGSEKIIDAIPEEAIGETSTLFDVLVPFNYCSPVMQ